MAKIKITTASGFCCTVAEEAIEDIRVFRAVRDYEKGDQMAVIDIIDNMLDEKTRTALEKRIKTKEGYIPASAYAKEAMDIFNAVIEQRKNSSSSRLQQKDTAGS